MECFVLRSIRVRFCELTLLLWDAQQNAVHRVAFFLGGVNVDQIHRRLIVAFYQNDRL